MLRQAESLLRLHLQVAPRVDQLDELLDRAIFHWAVPRRLRTVLQVELLDIHRWGPPQMDPLVSHTVLQLEVEELQQVGL